jgi:hypothetical protein
MLRSIALLLILGSLHAFGQSQNHEAGFDEVVWFGLDYTLVKFIGVDNHFSDLEKIRNYYFRAWNELIVTESSKYNIAGAFQAEKVVYDLDSAIARNERIDMSDIVQMRAYNLTGYQIADLVKDYVNPSVNMVGAIFVMETLNKIAPEESMWVTLFYVSTGELIMTRRFSGEPAGFGFRNYWAGAYYSVIKQCSLSRF